MPLLRILKVEGAHDAAVIEKEAIEFSERAGIYHKFTEFDKHILLFSNSWFLKVFNLQRSNCSSF